MQHDFPYTPGYIGELDSFSPSIAHDLKRLVQQLNPNLARVITQEHIAYFHNDPRFRQIIVVEEFDGHPAIVGTANISFLQHSYDSSGRLTDTPSLALGSFVVDENVRGKGVAVRIWNKILEIGAKENVHLMQFTSNPTRGAAHSFYAKMGAVQLTPVIGVKFKADGTEEYEGTTPPFEQQLELAKGLVVFIFAEAGAEQFTEEKARELIAKTQSDRFEQLIPTNNPDEATTTLFSLSF